MLLNRETASPEQVHENAPLGKQFKWHTETISQKMYPSLRRKWKPENAKEIF
jgi:hypothetical protein